MHSEEAVEHERNGANAGLNPMFGDWQQRFDFAPVPYSKGGEARRAFRDAVQSALRNKFFYSSEIRLDIVLHLDVQTVLETDETADVDNYSKAISDALKGPNGLYIDDTQIQALSIHWLDCYGRDRAHFDVSISSSPDDFLLKPVEFYEMPDGLWYPQGRLLWSDGAEDEQSDRNHYAGLLILEMMSGVKKDARHMFRKQGMDRLRAYQNALYLSSSARGFHRSRLDDDFKLHPIRKWREAFEDWRKTNADEIAPIQELLDRARENYNDMTRLISGSVPGGVPQQRSKRAD